MGLPTTLTAQPSPALSSLPQCENECGAPALFAIEVRLLRHGTRSRVRDDDVLTKKLCMRCASWVHNIEK